MRGLFLVLPILFIVSFLSAQNLRLSDKSEIVLLTMGPYPSELYAAFGHSAIRVVDSTQQINWVFNYGVFDYYQDNFYTNFAFGKMQYLLGLSYYDPFVNHYIEEDRTIKAQFLNLSVREKQRIFDFLLENYQPENQIYLYNYVYNNCATKIPQLFDSLAFTIDYDFSYKKYPKTFRDLMHDKLDYFPWGQWFIDICLGVEIDKVAEAEEYMFLPEYVFKAFEQATRQNEKMVYKTETLHQKQNEGVQSGFMEPMKFFILLFFIGGYITFRDLKKHKITKWFDRLLFFYAGLFGMILLFLWLGTDHMSKGNYDLLWALPTHLFFSFYLHDNKRTKGVTYYCISILILNIALLLFWAFLPEPLHPSLLPFVLLVVLRMAYWNYFLRKSNTRIIKRSNGQ